MRYFYINTEVVIEVERCLKTLKSDVFSLQFLRLCAENAMYGIMNVPFKQRVAGSSPAALTNKKVLIQSVLTPFYFK